MRRKVENKESVVRDTFPTNGLDVYPIQEDQLPIRREVLRTIPALPQIDNGGIAIKPVCLQGYKLVASDDDDDTVEYETDVSEICDLLLLSGYDSNNYNPTLKLGLETGVYTYIVPTKVIAFAFSSIDGPRLYFTSNVYVKFRYFIMTNTGGEYVTWAAYKLV